MKRFNNMLINGALGIAAITLASCATSGKTSKKDDTTKIENMDDIDNSYLILSDSQQKAIHDGNTFAINLFKTQQGMDSKVISPLSVAYLMGMLANGANGNTQEEIMNVMHANGCSIQTLNEAYKSIINMASRWDKQTTINIANCIAVNKPIKLNDDFQKTAGSMYDANIEELDFASPKALEYINGWCAKQTNGMIPKIVDKLNPDALMVLMNAIYFNGTWDKKFDKSNTKQERFQGYTRDIKRVQMMHQNDKFYYTDNDDFAAINLPYGNGTYSMTVILPNNGKSTTDIVDKLDAKKLEGIQTSMEKCIVDLKLPRFSSSTETNLNDPISKLGAPSIFSAEKADFSNMTNAALFVSAMIQKAKIEVSEEGTKAAAVTAGIMTMSALPTAQPRRVEFHADRPFIYIITERNTGAIFFMGQYTGPEN